MNYFDLVRLKKQIESQKLNVARAKEKGTSITIELEDLARELKERHSENWKKH